MGAGAACRRRGDEEAGRACQRRCRCRRAHDGRAAGSRQRSREANLRAGEASGGIGRVAAAQEQARLHAQAYREELERLDAEITRVNSDAALTPEQRPSRTASCRRRRSRFRGKRRPRLQPTRRTSSSRSPSRTMHAFKSDQRWLASGPKPDDVLDPKHRTRVRQDGPADLHLHRRQHGEGCPDGSGARSHDDHCPQCGCGGAGRYGRSRGGGIYGNPKRLRQADTAWCR